MAWLLALPLWSAVPEPRQHFGFDPGDDYKLADYQQIISYFQALEKSSPRIKLVEFGRSSLGKPMYVAFISDAQNLEKLEEYRRINQRLALGLASAEEARQLSRQGKAIVWIDSGLHANEVAPVQHAPHLAYRMLTEESEELRHIRQNVILMQVPVINPDGLDWIVHWYRKNVGTPYELAPLPHLYHKYAGHDNNRDWYMLNLAETRHVTRLLFEEWFPHIVYNQHQSPAFPARIFVPPYAEPLNPHIPAAVMEGINLIGSAMKERFARENKPGILSYYGFDAWWNGGLRSTPAFHNMHGILTETAGNSYATPRNYRATDLPERFGNGIPTREPSIFYQRPWLGGRWSLRDAVDYMLTADFAILDLAATRAEQFLFKAWDLARSNIALGNQGKPFAYLVSASQPDRYSTLEMLRRLRLAGIQIERAKASFVADGKSYPAGTYILRAAQPFRPYLLDLMEPQVYPEIRAGQSGPTKRPYDVAGWTLHMLMGVQVDRVNDAFAVQTDRDPDLRHGEPSLDHRDNSAFLATIAALESGKKVRWSAEGNILVEGRTPPAEFERAAYELQLPRVGLYEPFTANMDAGWTQWLLEHFQIPYQLLHNADMRAGGLRARFDAIILASQTPQSILHGNRSGEPVAGRRNSTEPSLRIIQRPEFTGGITLLGLAALDEFVRAGGTLIAFDAATDLPVQFFPLPVSGRLRPTADGDTPEPSANGFYSPGSLLRATVEHNSPIAFGMPKDITVFTTGGQVWDINLLPELNKEDREVKSIVRYAAKDLLASGWLSGERQVSGRSILLEARHGQGRVVLFGFRPQFRGQTFGTFKLVLNAIYFASARAR
ncbi:MAG: M14 family metallopeptidase [Bryobacteraceae bacterium]|nr:M14 family metallopeptidase [Bryobacteraceae bacterium]MDW8379772.1 M14 family metallopeptidase [Bryobacterales bacterium]